MIAIKENNLYLSDAWIITTISHLDKEIQKLSLPLDKGEITLNGQNVTQLDTSGAFVIQKLIQKLEQLNVKVSLSGFDKDYENLIELIDSKIELYEKEKATLKEPKKLSFLAKLGFDTINFLSAFTDFLSFIGEVSVIFLRALLNPFRIRWKTLFANVQTGGVEALFIIGLLNFLIGVVIAYQAGGLLKTNGVSIFIVDLVAISMLRELAPLLTAIIVAGRTGSAYAAQIGTMVVNEEVDALKTIGIHPFDQLVVPKVLALMISLPCLAIFADILGVFGGMFLANQFLDLPYGVFLDRIPEVMTVNTFLVGILKTPLFAIIIALTGCYQGFKVKGGADSVGKQTTISVVQAIFFVIICDAIFSILTRNVPI